jgi:curved DNA-binding protein CbpA
MYIHIFRHHIQRNTDDEDYEVDYNKIALSIKYADIFDVINLHEKVQRDKLKRKRRTPGEHLEIEEDYVRHAQKRARLRAQSRLQVQGT